MDLSKMTPEEARAIVMQAQNVFDASIADQQRTSPKEIQALPLDLTQARTKSNAMKVSFPFKSVLVEQATDLNTFIYLIPISNDSGNDPIRLGLKDIYKNEFGFRECYIYWDAQPNKSILLKFFVRSFLENGRLLLDQNSSTDEINIAGATVQNDGFSIIYEYELSPFPNGLAYFFSNIGLPVNDKSYNVDNVILIDGSNPGPTFIVPQGYYAEILGSEIDVTTATNTTNLTFAIGAFPKNTNINGAGVFSNRIIATSKRYSSPLALTTTPIIDRMSVTSTILTGKNIPRKTIDENEVPWILLSNIGATTTGKLLVRILYRLYKKVG